MNRKENYADMGKFSATKRNQQDRYRRRTGAFKYNTKWTQEADDMVMAQDITDRELSVIIHHSVGAIQHRRYRLRMLELENSL